MAATEAHQFLNDLDKKLWTAADKLRANLDAAVYSHYWEAEKDAEAIAAAITHALNRWLD